MYIVTEATETETHVRGVFDNRAIYDRNIEKILNAASLGSTINVCTGKANALLAANRPIESYMIELVPEVRKAVKIS